MKNTKGFASIALIIFVIAVAAGLGYFAFKKSITSQIEQPQNQQPTANTSNQPVVTTDETINPNSDENC